jgi:hypothetical protein
MTGSSPLAALYCADPNCKFCKELRELNEQLKKTATSSRTMPIETRGVASKSIA